MVRMPLMISDLIKATFIRIVSGVADITHAQNIHRVDPSTVHVAPWKDLHCIEINIIMQYTLVVD